jgi:hypothetical protein
MTGNNDKINICQMFHGMEETERWEGKYKVRVIIGKHSFSVLVTILPGRSFEKTFQVPSGQLASESITLKEGWTIATFLTKVKKIFESTVDVAYRSGQTRTGKVTGRPGSKGWLSSIMPTRRSVTSPEWV